MDIKVVVDEFVTLRTALDAARKEYKLYEKETKELMTELEVQLLEIADETGLDSFSSATHTAFKTTKSYARRSAEPDAFDRLVTFVQDTGDFMVFTAHVNKTHLKELIDEGINPEEIGLTWEEEIVIQVRKK